MSAPLVLVLAVALAYLAAHVAFDWLARRFLLVSGAEYLLLGILLGPQVSGVLSVSTMTGFAPLITLALGWIGAIVGTQFYLPGLIRIRGRTYRLAFIEAGLTLLVVAGLESYLLAWVFGLPLAMAVIPGVAMGGVAAVSAPAGIEVAARRLGVRGPLVRQLEVATAIDALVGVVTMGLLLCIWHTGPTSGTRPLTPTEWAVVTIALGLVGGTLFHLFLGAELAGDRLFISLAAAIILVSGAAAYLHLSPVLASMVLGATLINTSGSRQEIAQTLASSERPFYFVLLVFAGATWVPSSGGWAAAQPVALFLVVRVLAKIGTARLGARFNGALPELGADWGKALIGQGGLALALSLSYLRLPEMPLPNVVFTAAIASVLLTDITSARLIHSVAERLAPRELGRRLRGMTGEHRARGSGTGGGD